MKNTKRSPFLKVAAVMFAAIMIMSCVTSGTLAKYTSTGTASATATVAKWSIKASGTEIAATDPTIDFDLFSTVYDTDGTSAEQDVAGNTIAPGTSGKFNLEVKNESEVNAQYSIDFTVTNDSNVPLEFSTDDGANWSSTLSDVAATDLAMNNTGTTTIQWRWAYERDGKDAEDTGLGIAAQTAAPQVKVEATITATQVD